MFIVNWFQSESPEHPYGNPQEVRASGLAEALQLTVKISQDPTAIHFQIKGPGVDQGQVRDDQGNWVEQYNYIQS